MPGIRVAAIQMQPEVGDLDHNLSRAESLVREAFRRGAQLVVLPEFFPTAVAFTPAMLHSWQPLDGRPLQLLRDLAREHSGIIGGSFIARRGSDCFNSWVLVFPDGGYFRHDKDIPTMWENCYYVGGSDDGVLATPAGTIWIAMCWELIRSQTARRLLDRVDMVVGGSCWWDVRLPVSLKHLEDQQQLLSLLKNAPVHLARMLGVPVIHASHAGEFEGLTPGKEAIPYLSRFLGETQIVDGRGEVLARLDYNEGEGLIIADITAGVVPGVRAPIPESFWTAELPARTQTAWNVLNEFGKDYYRTKMQPLL